MTTLVLFNNSYLFSNILIHSVTQNKMNNKDKNNQKSRNMSGHNNSFSYVVFKTKQKCQI